METIKINNNISLHYIEMKKLKTTVTGVYIRRKLSEKEAALNAVLPYVLKSGCKKLPSVSEINKYLQSLYGASLSGGVIKNGDNQVIFFDAETISDKYAAEGEALTKNLMDLLMSVIFEPIVKNNSFDTETVEREKKTVINKINAMINDKRTYAQLRCIEEICRGDAFAVGKFGTAESVGKITAKDLYEHYKKILVSSQIDIFVCGDADCSSLVDKINQYTSMLEFKECEKTENVKIQYKDNLNRVTDKLDVTQGKLAIGFVTGINAADKDYPALVVANSIYGAGTQSKLFNNVREKLSLAYYASSGINKYKGIMTVNAGIEFENFQKAYDESILQLNNLKKGEISDDEFNFSINTIINNLDTYYDDQRYMQLYCLDCLYLGIVPDLEKYKNKIKSVTKDDIIKAASKIKEDTVYFLTGK